MATKIKLKGHETFYLREGWITKGIKAIKEDEMIFSKKEATDILGVGTGMVKAIKYWLIALQLITKSDVSRNGFKLSNLGKKIYENDLYIEDRFTLWILHYNLVTNYEFATAWSIYTNKFYVREFSKEELVEFINEELIKVVGDEKFSKKSLVDDCTCIVKSYLADKTKETPEENFKCPFSELGLLEKRKNRLGKEYFVRTKPNKKKFNKMALLYVIQNNSQRGKTTIENLIEDDNNIAKVFNLDRNDVNELLDTLEKESFLNINRTAGLNTVYVEERNVIEEYYRSKGR